MWVEMAVSWWNCSVLCRMWERGKEVIREWFWQPGLSRALRLVKLDAETCLLQKKWGILTRLWERRGAGRLQQDAFTEVSPHSHWWGQVLCDPPTPCHSGACCLSSMRLRFVREPRLTSLLQLRLKRVDACGSWKVRAGVCLGCECGV